MLYIINYLSNGLSDDNQEDQTQEFEELSNKIEDSDDSLNQSIGILQSKLDELEETNDDESNLGEGRKGSKFKPVS